MLKKENFLSFYLSKGNVEILNFLENNSPVQFKDVRNLKNPKTEKKFSSRTVSKRLKELEENGDISNEIVSINKRKTVGYTITNKGLESLKILRETESQLKKLKKE